MFDPNARFRSLARTCLLAGAAMSLLVNVPYARGATSVSSAPRSPGRHVRTDPNDADSRLDIHRVITNEGRHLVVLDIDTWDAFSRADLSRERFVFLLDTRGSDEFDRFVQIAKRRARSPNPRCNVFHAGEDFGLIGHRRAFHPDPRSVVCKLPRGWFDATKMVRFSVRTREGLHTRDKAPNRGRYAQL
jgi:hypothetical protein